MSRYVWFLASFGEVLELVYVGLSKLDFLPCVSLSTHQMVKKKILMYGFRSTANIKNNTR